MGATGFLRDVAVQRISGKRTSPIRAVVAATAAGAAAAGLTYRVLRK